MPIGGSIREKREEILWIAARHGAENVRLVGSVARGEEQLESDVDLLIDVVPKATRWFSGGLIGDTGEGAGRYVHDTGDLGGQTDRGRKLDDVVGLLEEGELGVTPFEYLLMTHAGLPARRYLSRQLALQDTVFNRNSRVSSGYCVERVVQAIMRLSMLIHVRKGK